MKNLKKILSALIIAIVIITSCTAALASSMTVVTTGKCNLRENAGLNYKSKTTIPSGTVLTATSKKTDSRGVAWLKVKYNGKTGWVSTVYLKKGTSPKKQQVVVATGDTYIRSKANKTSAKLGVLYAGCHATYLNKSSKDSRGVRWYKVSYGGNVGWVSSKNSYVK